MTLFQKRIQLKAPPGVALRTGAIAASFVPPRQKTGCLDDLSTQLLAGQQLPLLEGRAAVQVKSLHEIAPVERNCLLQPPCGLRGCINLRTLGQD